MAIADQNPHTPSPAADAPQRRDLAARLASWVAWCGANRSTAALVGGGALLAILALALGLSLWVDSRARATPAVTAEMVLEALDQGRDELARERAEQLRNSPDLKTEDLGTIVYALGVDVAHTADDVDGPLRIARFTLAARYLEEARDRGFPAGRRADGLLLLGKSLWEARRYVPARLALAEALAARPDWSARIRPLLVDCYRFDNPPDYPQALEENRRYLADASLVDSARQRAELIWAQLLFALDRVDEARAHLEAIADTSRVRSGRTILRARLLMHQAGVSANGASPGKPPAQLAPQEADRLLDEAIGLLREAQGAATLGSDSSPGAMYLIGVCYAGKRQWDEARGQLLRTRRLHPGTDEVLAAALLEADLLAGPLNQGEGSLAAYMAAIEAAGSPDSYRNRWVSLPELRERLVSAYQRYLKAAGAAQAVELAGMLAPLVGAVHAQELAAEAHVAWARSLSTQAASAGTTAEDELRREARRNLRQAGVIYHQLSLTRPASREYPDDLWNAASNLLAGGDYRNAARIFRKYLEIESRRRRAQGLVALGEALLALDQPKESLEVLAQCIELFANDAASYRARLLGSQAWLALGDMGRAKLLLEQNLTETVLTPQAVEWRASLLDLGKVLYREATATQAAAGLFGRDGHEDDALRKLEEAVGLYRQAIDHLSEFVERYGDDEALEANYLIGQSYRQIATLPQRKLESVDIATTRLALARERNDNLRRALLRLRTVQQTLNRRQENGEIPVAEAAMLRNSYMFQGATLLELGELDEAIRVYSTATNRYLNEPVALEAFVQLARCYRQKNDRTKARGILEQAKVVLERMPPELDYRRTTLFDYDGWSRQLDWQSQL